MLIENLVIYSRKPYKDSQDRNIYHSFPLPRESEQYSAQSWSGWDKQNSSATMLDFDQMGEHYPKFKGLELCDLEKRGNGGRAYQVLIPMYSGSNDFYRCDLREDTLLDAMLLEGIEKGGKLNGEYSFVRNGSQTNLVLVSSKEYQKHFEMAERKKNSKKISNKDLKVGYAYSTPKGVDEIYLGMYYQHGKTNIDYSSVKVDDKPSAFHVFAHISNKYPTIQLKKSQVYTLESEQPILTEEEAIQYMQSNYIEYSENRINDCLRDIENAYEKHHKKYEDGSGLNSTYYLRSAKEEVRKLSTEAFEMYRRTQTKASKSEVNYDRDYFHKRVKESEAIAEAKAEGKFFFTF